jgi:hypothetical protein
MPPSAEAERGEGGIRAASAHSAWSVAICAVGMAVACATLARAAILPGYSESWAAGQLLNTGAVLLAIYSYWRGYRALESSPRNAMRVVIGAAAILAVLNVVLPPFSSQDLYAYISQGWEQYHYHLNPYLRSVSSIPESQRDPMLSNWFSDLCVYGFLFARLERALAWLGGGNLYRTMLLFKATDLAAYAAIAWLIAAIGPRLKLERVDLALYLFLWNPMILIHHLSNGHNDLVMALFVMLAIYFAAAELWLLVLPAIAGGLLIKWIAGVILPFAFALVARRRGHGTAVAGSLVAAALVAASGASYIHQWSRAEVAWLVQPIVAQMYSLGSALLWSLMAFQKMVPLGISLARAEMIVASLFATAAAVLLLIQFARFSANRAPSIRNFVEVAVFAQVVVICVGLGIFWPHHVGMFFALAMVLDRGHWLRRLAIALTIFPLEYFTYLDTFRILNSVIMLALPMLWIGFTQWPEVKEGLAGRWSSAARRAPTVAAAQESAAGAQS